MTFIIFKITKVIWESNVQEYYLLFITGDTIGSFVKKSIFFSSFNDAFSKVLFISWMVDSFFRLKIMLIKDLFSTGNLIPQSILTWATDLVFVKSLIATWFNCGWNFWIFNGLPPMLPILIFFRWILWPICQEYCERQTPITIHACVPCRKSAPTPHFRHVWSPF